MAGGRGTRFWPLSREGRPKQFLQLAGSGSLLRQAWERYRPFIPPEDALTVAAGRYHDLIREQLPEISEANLLEEPSPRDTAPAAALAALEVRRRDPSGVMILSPSDHVVTDAPAFQDAVLRAVSRAGSGGLGTLGVRPDRPATSFGYLRIDAEAGGGGAHRVEAFFEKPDPATARRYCESGEYLWNAGIFVFRVDVFFAELRRAAPDLAAAVESLEKAREAGNAAEVARIWENLPRTSIDYALMERAPDVWTVPLAAGWDDLGSWLAVEKPLARDEQGNRAPSGKALFVETTGSTVFQSTLPGKDARLVTLVGLDDVIVVETDDVVLVTRRDRAESVKAVVERLRREGRTDLL
jgi:mannose-1-phosphate guanylyltransferase